MQIKPFSI